MLCEACNTINFQPLLTHDKVSVYHVLHQTRSSYSRSIGQRCSLCSLISSQLGNAEIKDDICEQLNAFMVLKCRRIAKGHGGETKKLRSVGVLSTLGFVSLTAIDPLPGRGTQCSLLHCAEVG